MAVEQFPNWTNKFCHVLDIRQFQQFFCYFLHFFNNFLQFSTIFTWQSSSFLTGQTSDAAGAAMKECTAVEVVIIVILVIYDDI